jgi:succinyl-CoA:acetate CoA-transferase
MKNKIEDKSLNKCIVSAKIAADYITDGMTVAMSGYAMAGYPKAVVNELVKRSGNGEKISLNILTGANVPWIDEKLSDANIVAKRAPMCANRKLASQINKGDVRYVEQQMSKMPRLIKSGSFGKIDVVIIEALAITKDGIIPTSSIGFMSDFLDTAEQVIVEINSAQPDKLAILHDIYIGKTNEPIPLTKMDERIGKAYIPVDFDKIKYIVKTDISECEDETPIKSTEQSVLIAKNLFDFLKKEYQTENKGLLPSIQMGFGNIADAVADAFQKSDFHDLQFFCGGVTTPVLELLASGKAKVITTGGIKMSDRVAQIIDMPDIEKKLILRNGDMMNNAETIARFSVIALNTGIEIDIYGNVNSSHISGTRVVNGIGGGANFAQNAGLSILMIPSNSKNGTISNIVPMVFHQDINEHDIDVVITENGICDLRGKDDVRRAYGIIENCSAEQYRDKLLEYLEKAINEYPSHHPQIPEDAILWYRRLKETGSMLERKSQMEDIR